MKFRELMEEAIERLNESGLTKGVEAGVSEQELREALGSAAGLVSPSYAMFMGAFGRSSGEFLQGSDLLKDDLGEAQKLAEEIRGEEPEAFDGLPGQLLVFAAHQGYQFLFVAASGDDAVVYRYLEGDGVTQVASSFAEWFAQTVHDEIQLAMVSGENMQLVP